MTAVHVVQDASLKMLMVCSHSMTSIYATRPRIPAGYSAIARSRAFEHITQKPRTEISGHRFN